MPDAPEIMHVTSLVLLRHGESTFNARGLYQGCSDEAILTEKGHAIARDTAKMLDGTQFDAVYVSPLRRARETADTLRTRLPDLPANEVRNELREIDLTAWEGMPINEVRARFADDYRIWKLYPERLRMLRQNADKRAAASFTAADEYAPVLEVRDRAKSFLDYIENRHTGDKLLVIAHGGFIRSLISTALDLPINKLHTIAQSNCGLSVIKRRNSSKWSLDALNLTVTNDNIYNVEKEVKPLLLLSTPELSIKLSSHFSPDLIIGQHTTISTMPEYDGTSTIIVPDDVEDAKSWWSRIEQISQTKAQFLHLIATRAILACILGHTIGLQSEERDQIVLRSDTFHIIQLPPKPYRAIVLLVNGNLNSGKTLSMAEFNGVF